MLPKILVIAGPTASGKTSLAVMLAKIFDGEVVSADSMQIYRGMNIATAKPTEEEICGIPHHLISILDKNESFSVAEFTSFADRAVKDILSRGKLPVIAGGTGLYIDTFVNNITLTDDGGDPKYRADLRLEAEQKGSEVLLDRLGEIDPETAKKLHPNNIGRIIRALEIYKTTGITMSEQIRNSRQAGRIYDPLFIGLSCFDREKLYERINLRVDRMIESGLIEEAKAFYADDSSVTAAAAIGYKELKPYLDGRVELSEAVECLKRETRRYAKRQLTWFKKNSEINWFYSDLYPSFSDLAEEAADKVRVFLSSEDVQ